MRYLCGMNAMLCVKFDEQNAKFHELKSEIREQKIKCESNFSELKNHIREINQCFENNNETIKNSLNKLEQSVERMEVVVMNPEKNKTNENMIPEKELVNDNSNIEKEYKLYKNVRKFRLCTILYYNQKYGYTIVC